MSISPSTNHNVIHSPLDEADVTSSNKSDVNSLSRVKNCIQQNNKITYSMQQLLLMMNNLTEDDASKDIDKKVKLEQRREMDLAGLSVGDIMEQIKQKMNAGNAGADRFFIVGRKMVHVVNDGNGHMQTYVETLAPAVPIQIPKLKSNLDGIQSQTQKVQKSLAELMDAVTIAATAAVAD